MRYLVLSLFLLVLLPATATAQEPKPTVPADTGYTFTPYNFEMENTVDISDNLNVFMHPSFVNPMGSTAITVWSMVNAADVISVFVILLLGLAVVWWVYDRVMSGKQRSNRDSSNPFRS